MSDIPYVYRPVPCPDYDVEGTESWLTDMAAKGLVLSPDGFFASFGIFEKREPQVCKYRLETAAPKKAFEYDLPDKEALALSEELGWTYVARRGEFYIFRSEDPSARELNTDPDVQALALHQLIRRTRSTVVWTVLEILFWFLYFTHGTLFLHMISLGTLYTLFVLTLFLVALICSVIRLIHLIRLRKKLTVDGYLDHHKNWRIRARRHYIGNALLTVAVIAALFIGLGKFSDMVMDEGYVPLTEYEGKPPFATIADLIPEGNCTPDTFIIPSEVKEWSTGITPVNIDWQEYATVTLPDGRSTSGSLSVYYHEAASPWIARRIAEEYRIEGWQDSRKKYTVLPVEDMGLSFAAAYSGSLHTPCLILQNGCRVMWIRFWETGDPILTFADWAAVFADSIR